MAIFNSYVSLPESTGTPQPRKTLVACVGSIWIYPRQDRVTEKITMYHPTYLFQTPSGVTQETVNRKGQARICDVAEKHWSCDELCEGCPKQEEIRRAKDFDRL
jgi:hypothetical protein